MITNSKIGYGGRLGNQMFQYAMLLGVSDKIGIPIGILKQNALITKEDGCLDLFTGKWISYRFYLSDCFQHEIPYVDSINIQYNFKEKYFHFDQSVFLTSDQTDFDGYFQSVKYFEHIMPQVKKVFTFKSHIEKGAFSKMHWPTDKEVVSIHIRRGDYLGIPDILPVCEREYFQEALSYFSDKEYTFVIFSDDLPWCKEVFGEDENMFYAFDSSPFIDMFLMSQCQHYIISNSTFSLWGALLSNNENKRVIAPKLWFGPKLQQNNTNDLLPKDWVRI